MSKIVYNVTVKISSEVHDDWLEWMIQSHIPEVIEAGKFLSYRIQRIIGDDGQDGVSYAIGYIAEDMAKLHQYQVHHASRLQEDHKKRYEGHYAAFRTLMEVINEG